ncbi:MAG: glycosyltransferase family 1 protein [Acidimicrobiaceae bacterium]|nr:glycosyltransferase family 1 protein [Acidimicrobiaceae bacterium]
MSPLESHPVRILRVIARMNVGGPAWQVSVLPRGLDASRFETRLIVGDVGEGEADFVDLRDPDLPLMRIPTLGRSVRFSDDLRAFIAIRRAIRDFQPDIVHTHTAKAGLLGRLAAATSRVPVRVHTYHGHLLHGYFSRFVSRTLVVVERLLARGTTALVAVGERVRDDLVAAGIGNYDQYTVIPPGVARATTSDRESARARLGLPSDVPVVLFVGRLTAIKRPDRLIDAMSLVLDHRPDVVLGLVGEGDLLEKTRLRAEPLGSAVRLLGWQPDIGDLYMASDCVVLTSDSEGMPVTLIEAAMAGVPAVTTDVGSAGEVVLDGVTGLVVAPEAAAVADGLLRLLDPDLRDQMGAAALARADAEFSVERLIADHAALYDRLMSALGAGGPQSGRG